MDYRHSSRVEIYQSIRRPNHLVMLIQIIAIKSEHSVN